MQIAIPLFERVTALDAVGPYEVLQRLPGAHVVFVGAQRGSVRTENGFLGLCVDATFAEVPRPDLVVVPGGFGTRAFLQGRHALLDWLAAVHTTTRFTTSVCTGSLVLAAAGLLADREAATHWAATQELVRLGARPSQRRVVEHLQDRLLTAAGVSAGIDMALRLAELVTDRATAEAMQLLVEYDPAPPFDAGCAARASAPARARALELNRAAIPRD